MMSPQKSKPKLIIGIDYDEKNIEIAKRKYEGKAKNLRFIYGKASDDIPNEKFNVIILSNILEHQDDRVNFLKELLSRTQCARVLIRVPLFERDWRVPLKKELGVRYFSDPTHRIEYTLDEFVKEVNVGGLEVKAIKVMWGEIWAICVPRSGGKERHDEHE